MFALLKYFFVSANATFQALSAGGCTETSNLLLTV
jgi:hypothetical protein